MRGVGGNGEGGIPEKWLRINQLIRDKKIAVLALQETHLTQERIDNLNELFAATMKVFGSADEQNATAARGVAFAINKRLLDTEMVSTKTLIQGRAMEAKFMWSTTREMKILNVYAPNDARENAEFWNEISQTYADPNNGRPTMILGDCNMVESPMDRLPARKDADEQADALRALMRQLDLVDGMRERNPATRMFTYLQAATGSQSRIDRIYAARDIMKSTADWKIDAPGIRTDHQLVSMSVANYGAPHTGEGRWTIPSALLSDKIFIEEMKQLGMKAQTEIENLKERTERDNIQRIYDRFKYKLRDTARARAKAAIPKLDREINALKKDLKTTLNKEKEADSEPSISNAAILQERLAKLTERRFGQKRSAVAANDWAKGETEGPNGTPAIRRE
ncbi:Endonuclease/exonuclease/phosphatase [Earliella scabrosa]|nr:Endonuclease/exonuclease/phosphatase [Earliella scabrosa]